MPILPGEIYYITSPKRRPIIIVSRQEFNEGNYVVAIPLTTQNVQERSILPNSVFIAAGEFGVLKDSIAQAELLSVTDKYYVDLDHGPVGTIDIDHLNELVAAIGYVVGSRCSS